ncbi:carbohydrate kinase family protein [uncultured Schumannella sp.]|uniref:carbohydrate kinase family protein n=1 Tax=uncultured Schumannella sp. TaxID=1195956 RepID=UPI0025FC0E93|nr:PfkB family carbohydrate kinase [uncultured Schumannella sp.]
MSGSRFVVIGDVINDIVVVPRGEILVDADTTASVRPRPGGSAANTAAWLGTLGVDVDFVGCVGGDSLEWHSSALRDHGVTPHLKVEPGFATGTIVIVVEGEHRTMLTERGANSVISPDLVTEELLERAALLHLSGYSIVDGYGEAGARDLIDRATAHGVPVSVNPGAAGYIVEFGVERFLTAIAGATVFFPNLAEGKLLTGRDDPEGIAKQLVTRIPVVVVTLGSEGALVAARGEKPILVPAPNVRLVDPTGAGDAFAAGFLETWIATGSLELAGQSGAQAAARAIMVVGGRPAI